MKTERINDETIKGKYYHFKGNVYEALGLVMHSETEEVMVLYQSQDGRKWVRPLDMFLETIEHEGEKVKRFAKIEGA